MKRRAQCYLSRSPYRLFFAICIGIALIGLTGLIFDRRPMMQSEYWPYLFFPVIPVLIYGRLYWRLTKIRNEDLDRQVVARIEAELVSIDAGGIITTLRWQAIKRLWKFPDLFFLFTDDWRPMFVTIPVGDLTDEAKAFIEEKVRAHGGQVA